MSIDCCSVSVYVTTLLRTGREDGSSRHNGVPVTYSPFSLVSKKSAYSYFIINMILLFFTLFQVCCSNKLIFLNISRFNFNGIYASLVLILLFTHTD